MQRSRARQNAAHTWPCVYKMFTCYLIQHERLQRAYDNNVWNRVEDVFPFHKLLPSFHAAPRDSLRGIQAWWMSLWSLSLSAITPIWDVHLFAWKDSHRTAIYQSDSSRQNSTEFKFLCMQVHQTLLPRVKVWYRDYTGDVTTMWWWHSDVTQMWWCHDDVMVILPSMLRLPMVLVLMVLTGLYMYLTGGCRGCQVINWLMHVVFCTCRSSKEG